MSWQGLSFLAARALRRRSLYALLDNIISVSIQIISLALGHALRDIY
jgi:hypothetical protein